MRHRIVRVKEMHLVMGQGDIVMLIEYEMERGRSAFRRTTDDEVRKSQSAIRHRGWRYSICFANGTIQTRSSRKTGSDKVCRSGMIHA